MSSNLAMYKYVCVYIYIYISVQQPGVFEDDLVSSQLRHSGVLETIRIRREGYPVRMPFYVFLFR